jgi:hypothetical protein
VQVMLPTVRSHGSGHVINLVSVMSAINEISARISLLFS